MSTGGAGGGSGIGVCPGWQGHSQFGLGIETYGSGSVTLFGKSLSFWRYSVKRITALLTSAAVAVAQVLSVKQEL